MSELEISGEVRKLGDVKAPKELGAEIMSKVRRDRSFLGFAIRTWKIAGVVLLVLAILLQIMFLIGTPNG